MFSRPKEVEKLKRRAEEMEQNMMQRCHDEENRVRELTINWNQKLNEIKLQFGKEKSRLQREKSDLSNKHEEFKDMVLGLLQKALSPNQTQINQISKGTPNQEFDSENEKKRDLFALVNNIEQGFKKIEEYKVSYFENLEKSNSLQKMAEYYKRRGRRLSSQNSKLLLTIENLKTPEKAEKQTETTKTLKIDQATQTGPLQSSRQAQTSSKKSKFETPKFQDQSSQRDTHKRIEYTQSVLDNNSILMTPSQRVNNLILPHELVMATEKSNLVESAIDKRNFSVSDMVESQVLNTRTPGNLRKENQKSPESNNFSRKRSCKSQQMEDLSGIEAAESNQNPVTVKKYNTSSVLENTRLCGLRKPRGLSSSQNITKKEFMSVPRTSGDQEVTQSLQHLFMNLGFKKTKNMKKKKNNGLLQSSYMRDRSFMPSYTIQNDPVRSNSIKRYKSPQSTGFKKYKKKGKKRRKNQNMGIATKPIIIPVVMTEVSDRYNRSEKVDLLSSSPGRPTEELETGETNESVNNSENIPNDIMFLVDCLKTRQRQNRKSLTISRASGMTMTLSSKFADLRSQKE